MSRNVLALMLGACSTILITPLPAQQVQPDTVLRYVILSNGKPAGSEVDTYAADEHVESQFEFNDRGRGPKTVSKYTLGAAGLPQSTEITGNDYLKAPVDEHYDFANGTGTWKSTSEHGQSSSAGFYISNSASPMELALLIGALVKADGKPVNLLPAGQAKLEKLADTTVENARKPGEKLHVTEYAITGLSFSPATLWLDDDLHMLASPGSWFAILREGWESTNDQLFAQSLKEDDTRYERLAKELSHTPSQAVAIEHG